MAVDRHDDLEAGAPARRRRGPRASARRCGTSCARGFGFIWVRSCPSLPHRSRRFFRNKTPDACFVLKPSFMCRQKFIRADLLKVRQYVSVADRPCAQRITPRFTSVLWLIVGAEPARYTCLPASATASRMLQRIGQRAASSMASAVLPFRPSAVLPVQASHFSVDVQFSGASCSGQPFLTPGLGKC